MRGCRAGIIRYVEQAIINHSFHGDQSTVTVTVTGELARFRAAHWLLYRYTNILGEKWWAKLKLLILISSTKQSFLIILGIIIH